MAQLGRSKPVGPCITAEDIAEALHDLSTALGDPGVPDRPEDDTIQPVYYDPTGGDDGEPAIIIPGTEGTPSTPVVGGGGTIVSGGGGGTTYTAGAGIDISTGDVIATDNDTSTYLGYTGSGESQQNAILWELIPNYAQSVVQVLTHTNTGSLKWTDGFVCNP